MTERGDRLEAVAARLADYRADELGSPDAGHVDRWVRQFHPDVQMPILTALSSVLDWTYLSRARVAGYFGMLIDHPEVVARDGGSFWKDAHFLRIQQNGISQHDLLKVFDEVLEERLGVTTSDCGREGGPYIYVDDGLFSGHHVRTDLTDWITQTAPREATVHIVVLASHRLATWEVGNRLREVAASSGKAVRVEWKRVLDFENRLAYRDTSDVLWPAELPDDEALHAYLAKEMQFPFVPRQAGASGGSWVFKSSEERSILERELLLAGVRIRSVCREPRDSMRPLGYSRYGLGFGSMVVTYRNCPNNAPLALWWGDPKASTSHPFSHWYPLVPRAMHSQDPDFDGSYGPDDFPELPF